MRQSQSSVLPKTGHARSEALWPLAIGGAAALAVSGFMMVSGAPIHTTHQPTSVTRVHGGQP
jgi:hypothetical protein